MYRTIIQGENAFRPPDIATKLREAVIDTAILRVGGAVLTSIANHVMKKNTGDLKRSIEKEVSAFIREHSAELQIICASAAYKNGKPSCDANTYNSIVYDASRLISKHVKTYHGDAQTTAKGVASGLLGMKFSRSNNPFTWASYGVAAGLDAGIGLAEALTSTDYVLEKLDGSVKNLFANSLQPKAIFQQKLQNSYSSDAINILEIIEPAIFNFAQSSLNCAQIDNINLNSFESKRAGIKSICNDVANLLQPTTSQSAKNILKTRLTDSLLNRMQGILSNSFIEPTANFLASGAAHKINQQINEHIARMKEQEKKQRLMEQAANEWDDPDKEILWRNPDDVPAIKQKTFDKLTKNEQQALNNHDINQSNLLREAHAELGKIKQQEKDGLLTKEQAQIKSSIIRRHYYNMLQSHYNSFIHQNPELVDLAYLNLDTSIKTLFVSNAYFLKKLQVGHKVPLSFEKWIEKKIALSLISKSLGSLLLQQLSKLNYKNLKLDNIKALEQTLRQEYNSYRTNYGRYIGSKTEFKKEFLKLYPWLKPFSNFEILEDYIGANHKKHLRGRDITNIKGSIGGMLSHYTARQINDLIKHIPVTYEQKERGMSYVRDFNKKIWDALDYVGTPYNPVVMKVAHPYTPTSEYSSEKLNKYLTSKVEKLWKEYGNPKWEEFGKPHLQKYVVPAIAEAKAYIVDYVDDLTDAQRELFITKTGEFLKDSLEIFDAVTTISLIGAELKVPVKVAQKVAQKVAVKVAPKATQKVAVKLKTKVLSEFMSDFSKFAKRAASKTLTKPEQKAAKAINKIRNRINDFMPPVLATSNGFPMSPNYFGKVFEGSCPNLKSKDANIFFNTIDKTKPITGTKVIKDTSKATSTVTKQVKKKLDDITKKATENAVKPKGKYYHKGVSKKVNQPTKHPIHVDKIGTNYPRNAKYADTIFDLSDITDKMKIKYPDIKKDYPKGVYFDKKGFPDFRVNGYVKKEVKVKGLTGRHDRDMIKANRVAGFKGTPKGYTWHHVEDGITMQLVPTDLHNVVSHTGGAAIIKNKSKRGK